MARTRKHIGLARSLRKNEVPAEAMLWRALRNRALAGYKFRRQHPVGPYILDFACVECKLAVELDGLSHLPRKGADEERTQFLQTQGWCVIRFWNTQIYEELEPVKEAIYRHCVARSGPGQSPLTPDPSPPALLNAARREVVAGRGERGARMAAQTLVTAAIKRVSKPS